MQNIELTALEVIKDTLKSAIRKLVHDRLALAKQLAPDDPPRLAPETQHAVRVLEAMMRLIDRDYYAIKGSPAQRSRALLEKSLQHLDRGDLLMLAGRQHGIGRFDCRACVAEPLPNGMFPVPMARLCTSCHGGIQHLFEAEVSTLAEPLQKVVLGALQGRETVSMEVGATGEVLVVQLYHCDACGAEELRKEA